MQGDQDLKEGSHVGQGLRPRWTAQAVCQIGSNIIPICPVAYRQTYACWVIESLYVHMYMYTFDVYVCFVRTVCTLPLANLNSGTDWVQAVHNMSWVD